jgi:DNA-binding CsgD family transcriptional regulator
MADAISKRQVTALIGRCYAGLDAASLRDEVLSRLRRIMTVDAAFFGTVDPQTLLFTSAAADDPLRAATPLFLDNEYGRADVNKFAALAGAPDPVSSLDRATRGQRAGSARYREVMSPLGLGDELRAALITGDACWGVLCLHREDAAHGFGDSEVDLIRRIAPHVAEGLRRAVTLGPLPAAAVVTAGAAGPGMIVLDHHLTVISLNAEAAQWLAEIDEADWPSGSELPMAVYAAAARLTRLEEGAIPDPLSAAPLSASVRLRSRSGQWLSLHASRLGGPSAPQVGVVIAPTPAAQVSSLLLSAHGLTGAQSRVVALVIKGHSTRQIVGELHISAHTVQEHLTAAFDKFGVRSRRELVAAMLAGPPPA